MFFITRALFTMMFWVVLARWSYSEIAQVSPYLQSSVDRLLEVAAIPTHDKWDFTQVREVADDIVSSFKVEKAYAGQDD